MRQFSLEGISIVKLTVRLTEAQHRHLKKQAKECGLKMEPFVRKLIMGIQIFPRPPDTYLQLIREINAIGNTINQIAFIANAERHVAKDKINEAVRLVDEIMEKVRDMPYGVHKNMEGGDKA